MLRDRQYDRYDRHARENGLSTKAFLVVNALYYARGGLPQSCLCETTFNSRQTVSLVVKRLVEQGYATIEANSEDRRNGVVSMTDDGRAWAHGIVRRVTRAEDEAMAMLNPEERGLLVSPARRLTDGIVAGEHATMRSATVPPSSMSSRFLCREVHQTIRVRAKRVVCSTSVCPRCSATALAQS